MITNISSEHAFITKGYGNACDYHGSPFINDCDFDSAGSMLQHLYNDSLIAPEESYSPDGEEYGTFISFDQKEFLEFGYLPKTAGLNE